MAEYKTGTGLYVGENIADIIEIKDMPMGKKISGFAREIISYKEKTKIGAIVALEDKDAIDAVKRCLGSSGIITEYVNAALIEKDISIRYFSMPRISKQARAEAIRFEARKYIPFRIEDTISSFIVREEKGTQMSVLFAGAKKERVKRQVSIIEGAGLKTAFIGTVPEALCALLKFNDQLEKDRATLVVHIGDGETSGIYIIKDEVPYLTRDVHLNVDQSKLGSKLAGEIQSSVDYFRRQFPGFDISKIVIAGEIKDTQLCEYITGQLGIACRLLDITGNLKSDIEVPPGACVAVGLALIALEKPKKAYMNLIPSAMMPKEEELLKPALITGICALAFLLGIYFFFAHDAGKIKSELDQVLRLSPRVEDRIKSLPVEALKHYQESLTKEAAFLGSVTNGRTILTKKLNQVPVVLPKSGWVTVLKYEEEVIAPSDGAAYPKVGLRRMKIEGVIAEDSRSQEIEEANDLVIAIRKNTDLFEDLTDANIKSTKVIKFPQTEATRFDIELTGK